MVTKGRKAKRSRDFLVRFYENITKLTGKRPEPVGELSNSKLSALCKSIWDEQSDEFRELYLRHINSIVQKEPVKVVWNPKVGA